MLMTSESLQVWNSLEINEMIKDADSGYSYEEGLLFEASPSVYASDGRQTTNLFFNNILMSDKVRASSENPGNLASYAADGNLSTFWTPKVRPRPQRSPYFPIFHWLEIDLGREETVRAVTIRSGHGCLDSDSDASGYQYDDYDFHR